MTEVEKASCLNMMRSLDKARKQFNLVFNVCVLSIVHEDGEHFVILRKEYKSHTLTISIYPSLASVQGFYASRYVAESYYYLYVDDRSDYFNPHFHVMFVGKDAIDKDQREGYIAAMKEVGQRVGGVKPYPMVTYWDGCHAPTSRLSEDMMDLVRTDIDILLSLPESGDFGVFMHNSVQNQTYLRILQEEDGLHMEEKPLPDDEISMGKPDYLKLDKEKLETVQEREKQGKGFSYFYPVERPILLPSDDQRVYPLLWYAGVSSDKDSQGEAGAQDRQSKAGEEAKDEGALFLFTVDPDKDKEKLLDALLEYFIKRDTVPETIYYHPDDLYSRYLLRGFCRKLGIKLNTGLNRQVIAETLEDYVEDYDRKHQEEEKGEECSYVIRASLSKECYRDIQISGNESYESFAAAVVAAFAFDMDHLYYFQLPQLPGDDRLSGEFFHTGYKEFEAAGKLLLRDSNLRKGLSFHFVYDIGDYWRFTCKVLKVLEEDTEDTWQVVGYKGEAPEQYD